MDLLQRLKSPGPKRILALDGGGIRGAMTLGYLEKIQEILRKRHNNPSLKLCDYFDLVGGTSTGSIIASALAIGMDAAKIKEMYLDLGGKVFTKNRWYRQLQAFFDPEQLRGKLKEVFGDRTLGDATIETGLCVVAKRADTGSTWPMINHPEGKYYPHNKDMLLRRVIRASTAAPTYFEPEAIDVGAGQMAAFVDGGVSMANNPALQLFLMATLKGFPFHWETGENNLLLVSIGTGVWQVTDKLDAITGAWLKTWAEKVPSMLMDDASWQNQLILQYLSRSKTPWMIDGEVGDLSDDLLTPAPAMTYLRYNAWLDEKGLKGLGLERLVNNLSDLREMSSGESRFDLAAIGEAAAARDVTEDHFPGAFDLPLRGETQ